MCDGILTDIFIQRPLITSHQVDFISQTPSGNWLHLPSIEGKKSFYLRKPFQKFSFLQKAFTVSTEIFHGISGIFIGTGQHKRIKLRLTGGNGNHFYNIFFIRIFLDGRTAYYTMVFRDGTAKCETIQQRRDVFNLRQDYRLL